MVKINELQPGDSLLCAMKTGYALQKQRTATGIIYRVVPGKPDRFDKDDLQQFAGYVVSNDTVNHILRVECARITPYTRAVETSLPAEIHYLALKRVRRVSKFAHAPRPQNPLRPTNIGLGTGFHAYRTQEEVLLVWS